MNIDFYEKIWMWAAALVVVVFMAFVGVSTFAQSIHPPSHVETIDPTKVFQDARFSRLGIPTELPDGTIEVQMAALMFSFVPNEVRVPAGRRIRFRMTSVDVTHGFLVSGTNANTMLVPGYISQFTTIFNTPGDYLVVCQEFCGNGHHAMHARILVGGGSTVVSGASPAHAEVH
jgi:cytochrome c oxidase subunit 2